MEDINAAVEDAEYVRAMRDSVPQPTKDWDWMAASDLAKYIEQKERTNPKLFQLETVTSSALGLYLFIKFVKDNNSTALGNFVVAVAALKSAPDYSILTDTRHIIQEYLVEGSLGVSDSPPVEWPVRVDSSAETSIAQSEESAGSIKRGGNNAVKLCGERVSRLITAYSEPKRTGTLSPLSSLRRMSSTPLPSLSKPVLIHNKAVFDTIEREVFAILKDTHWEAFTVSEEWARYHQFMAMQAQMQKDGMKENKDFFVLRLVGRGGFGQVNACKKATTGKLYAMKQMSKRRIKMKRCEAFIVSERDFLTQVHSPYVVNLAYAFASATDVYLVLDLMIGGDLSYHIKCRGSFTLQEAKYYVARTLLGIAALHDLNIVHRDLKPENILMDVHGRTRISDFGLAAAVPAEGLLKCCGTRGYWAPEVIARPRMPYFLSADWFALGVCLYELLTGNNPFFLGAETILANSPEFDRSQFESAVDRATLTMEPDLSCIGAASAQSVGVVGSVYLEGNIKNESKHNEETSARSSVASIRQNSNSRSFHRRFSASKAGAVAVSPAVCAEQARDLLHRLLCKDPHQRIGSGNNGGNSGSGSGHSVNETSAPYSEIMAHAWFADIDWATLNSMPPPWCPEQEINMKAQSEIGEFSDLKETNALQLNVQDQAHYADWTYVSERALQQEIVDFLRYEELRGPIRPATDSACCTVS